MGNLKRALLAVLALLLALAVLAFSLENQQSVSLIFLGWAGPKLPLSLITITALLVGMIVGPTLYWVFMRRSRVSKKAYRLITAAACQYSMLDKGAILNREVVGGWGGWRVQHKKDGPLEV